MSPRDLLDTLEDLMTACSSQSTVSTDIFTVLIAYLFLEEGHSSRNSWNSNLMEIIPRWFEHLRDVFHSHTSPGPGSKQPSRNDVRLTRLSHYFVGLSWSSLAFLYPRVCDLLRDPFSKSVENCIECLKDDMKEECYRPITLVYSLYRHCFPEKVFYSNFSEFLATPEVKKISSVNQESSNDRGKTLFSVPYRCC